MAGRGKGKDIDIAPVIISELEEIEALLGGCHLDPLPHGAVESVAEGGKFSPEGTHPPFIGEIQEGCRKHW